MIIPFKNTAPKIHKSAFVAPTSSIIGKTVLGKDSSVWFGAVLRGDINSVEVGAESNIQDNCVLHVEKNTPCIVKNRVTVGHQATIHACVVQKGCLIGIGATILNQAVVGRYSIIGAGAVVTQGMKIPPRSLVLGTPAKVVRKLNDREIDYLEWSADNYVKLSKEYKKQETGLLVPDRLQPIDVYSELFGQGA